MKKQISPKIVSLIFGILIICFAVGFYVFAWTEPTVLPPDGNVDAPVNVGDTLQTKSGGLGVSGPFRAWGGAMGADDGLTVSNGNVGIGTTNPSVGSDGTQLKLDVEGAVGAIKYCDENGDNCKTAVEMWGNKYNSGWFIVNKNTTYTKSHGLGNVPFMVQIWLSDTPDGSGRVVVMSDAASIDSHGLRVVDVDSTNIKIRGSGHMVNVYDANGALWQEFNTLYVRITAIAF